MIKKLFSFIFCLMPIGAMAEPQYLSPSDDVASFAKTDGLVIAGGDDGTESVIVGSNIDTLTNPSNTAAASLAISGGAVTIDNNLIVGGYIGSTTGSLFILGDDATVDGNAYKKTTAKTTGFTLTSVNPITIKGILQVQENNIFAIGQTGTNTTNMTVGSISNYGSLSLTNIGTLTATDTIRNNTGASLMDINAITMNTQSIANASGTMNIGHMDTDENDNDVIVMTGGLDTNGGTIISSGTAVATNIISASIQSGRIQNGVGTMEITTGNLTATGTIENTSGKTMKIDANDIKASGAITNTTGDMTITAASLLVTGSDSTHNNASFVNSGNLVLDITGATTLANGFDLSAMGVGNVLDIKTGTLNVTSNNWLQLFANKLSSAKINVTNGGLDATTADIINGKNGSVTNAGANMTIAAQYINANSVTNSGSNLDITATTGAINIANGVTATSGETDITAGTTITTGAVENSAQMTIKGTTTTTVASVTNNAGGTLSVMSGTNSNGTVRIGTVDNNDNIITNGDVTNSGTLNINASNITMGNLTNTGNGTTTIQGSGSNSNSDKLTVGTVKAQGGAININALAGDVTVNGDLIAEKNATGGGAINIGTATKSVTTTGDVIIDGNVTLSGESKTGNGAVNISGNGVQNFVLTSGTSLTVKGDIEAIQNDANRTAQFVAGTGNSIEVDGNVTASDLGHLIFGNASTSTTKIIGDVVANKTQGNTYGTIEFYGDDTSVGSLSGNGKFIVHGAQVQATDGDINIGTNTIWFDAPANTHSNGILVRGTNTLTLTTQPSGGDIIVGGVDVASGNTLNLTSANDVKISGIVTDNGTLNITAANLAKIDQDVTVSGTLSINAKEINMADLTNNNSTELVATNITTGQLNAQGGIMNITAGQNLNATAMDIASGAKVNLAADATFTGPVTVNGNMVQGSNPSVGALNITKNGTVFTADSLTLNNGNFIANGNSNVYNITNDIDIGGDITVNAGRVDMSSLTGTITAKNIKNDGTLHLNGSQGIDISGGAITSSGALTLNSGTGYIQANTAALTGTTTLMGLGLNLTGDLSQNMLRQNYVGTLGAGDVNIVADKYTISTSGATLNGIVQESGTLTMNTSNLEINRTNPTNGNIEATNLTVAAPEVGTWLTVNVKQGSVSGNTKFVGLQHMTIGGNYVYNSNSGLDMVILPASQAGRDYWATVSRENDNTLGQITNVSGNDAEPLISVTGKLITQLDNTMNPSTSLLSGGQMSVRLFSMVDQGTAIWLLKADSIVEEGTKIRNVSVLFCNNTGDRCFAYLPTSDQWNNSKDPVEDLPAYISVRDTTEDGTADSLYLVFDPRFGGPVEIFKIQPIVDRENNHTDGEHVTAGALDDMIAGRLHELGFYNRTPIEAIPFIFGDTNMSQMAQELYNRMEYYELDKNRDGSALARFSRLFQPREIEQLAGSIALNEHTSFRDFEDHMLDEFIWNRNRNLRKAWGEFDFGRFSQNGSDDKTIEGNRFSFTGGYDWQETNTLILGLAGRVSHMSGNNSDKIDLGYKPGQHIAGSVDVDVADTNFGIGAYLLKTLNTKMRAYGNAFLDMHWLDVSRKQTYMSSIEGDGNAFSLISEWGLMHDWLNQYIVGNVYARVGYNFGFSVTEKAEGSDYMKMESDGYFIATPGYSLIAQKRIYPSAWFQIRPYASVGVEYDLLGMPDTARFKFAEAEHSTKYKVDIDPLWANIGGGMEFLSATGVQVGLDYRYQYNSDIQMHKIKISGSYRF